MPLFWRTGLGMRLAWGTFCRESRVDTKLMSKPQDGDVEGRVSGNQTYIHWPDISNSNYGSCPSLIPHCVPGTNLLHLVGSPSVRLTDPFLKWVNGGAGKFSNCLKSHKWCQQSWDSTNVHRVLFICRFLWHPLGIYRQIRVTRAFEDLIPMGKGAVQQMFGA